MTLLAGSWVPDRPALPTGMTDSFVGLVLESDSFD